MYVNIFYSNSTFHDKFLFVLCSDSVLRNTSSDFKKMGPRIFVFIIGGATRSEVKCQVLPSSDMLSTICID